MLLLRRNGLRQSVIQIKYRKFTEKRISLEAAYSEHVTSGMIEKDKEQVEVLEKLEESADDIIRYFERMNDYWEKVGSWEKERKNTINSMSGQTLTFFRKRKVEKYITKYEELMSQGPNSFGFKEKFFSMSLFSKNAKKSWQDLHDEAVRDLQREIIRYDQEYERSMGISDLPQRPAAPRGLYLYGNVGTGKTMLMNLLQQKFATYRSEKGISFNSHEINNTNIMTDEDISKLPLWSPFTQDSPVSRPPTRVVWCHSTDLLRKVYRIIHYSNLQKASDPHNHLDPFQVCISSLNGYLAEIEPPDRLSTILFPHSPYKVDNLNYLVKPPPIILFVDEFQMVDVGDSSLLRSLFVKLVDCGSIIITSCNLPPQHLFQSTLGVEYQKFGNFVDENFTVLSLPPAHRTPTDYRQKHHKDQLQGSQAAPASSAALPSLYFSPDSVPDAFQQYNDLWNSFTSHSHVEKNHKLQIQQYNRHTNVPLACFERKVARFSFAELCANELSSIDYATIISSFPIIFVDDIPQLNINLRNETRRFITFIDQIYNTRGILICSSSTPIDSLFKDLPSDFFDAQEIIESLQFERTDNYEKLVTKESLAQFKGKNEKFAFSRAVSRLHEFQTNRWLKLSPYTPPFLVLI